MHEPAPAALNALPRELHHLIFDNLDYETSIALSQTNRLFHNIVSPQRCATKDKELFVFKAELFGSHRRNSMYGCYFCYRILPATAFSDYDHRPTKHNHVRILDPRRCLCCAIKQGFISKGSATQWRGKHVRFCGRCLNLREGRSCPYCELCEQCLFEASSGDFVAGRVRCSWCKDTFRLRLSRGEEERPKAADRSHWTVSMWIEWLVFFDWVICFRQWCRELRMFHIQKLAVQL